MMRSLAWVALLIPLGASAQSGGASADNALTPGEIAEGWRLLFDGRTLAGWRPVGSAMWRVEEGTISVTIDADARGDLQTAEEFSDFQLRVDFWTEKRTSNSGIYLRCTASPSEASGRTCYELNISDASDAFPTGSLVNVQSTLPGFRAESSGRWNTLDVTADGSHFSVSLNGRQTVDANDTKLSGGTIGLQGGGMGLLRFRHIKIRPIAHRQN